MGWPCWAPAPAADDPDAASGAPMGASDHGRSADRLASRWRPGVPMGVGPGLGPTAQLGRAGPPHRLVCASGPPVGAAAQPLARGTSRGLAGGGGGALPAGRRSQPGRGFGSPRPPALPGPLAPAAGGGFPGRSGLGCGGSEPGSPGGQRPGQLAGGRAQAPGAETAAGLPQKRVPTPGLCPPASHHGPGRPG